jgi:RND family efflux transporter MFP subunit
MPEAANSPGGTPTEPVRYRLRAVPVAVTLMAVVLAGVLTYAMWQAYVGSPWTRDGSVRVYVVTLAPEVSGRVVALPVADNQFVHKGDLLMTIDKRDYEIAVKLAEANVAQAKADYENKQTEAQRRAQLTELATTPEEKQTYAATAQVAAAVYQQALANLDKAKLNLERTDLRSEVNGWVTNLQTQLGDYATMGQRALTLVDADSFWVDGYFEETKVAPIQPGDPAKIWLLGYRQMLPAHVDSIARGIEVSNAQAGSSGLANVNPIFTWVRLAQRLPVRLHIDSVPPDVRLVAGMTATVEVDPRGK